MTRPLLSFIHITDTHIHSNPNFTGQFVDFSSRLTVAQMIDHINALPFHIDFILHTGDIMTDPDRNEDYLIAKDILKEINYPIYYVTGNHDRSHGIRQYLMGQDLPPVSPPNLDYTTDINGVQLVCLDSNCQQNGSHWGKIDDKQLAWLNQVCSAEDDRPLVVAIHHHVLPLETPWLDAIVLKNGEAVHKILLKAKNRLRGVFYGHIHENTVTVRDGISYYSGVSSWFQTRTWFGQEKPSNDPLLRETGFNVVTVTERDTFVRRYRFPLL